jgi:hypothetical protein
MTLEQRDYILNCVGRTDGDDLERAENAFRNLSEQQLDQQYGQSGTTCRQILDGYRTQRAFHKAVYAALEELLRV